MSTLTIRINDDKHERLKIMAQAQGMSVNRLMDELASIALSEFDAKTHFQIRASRGQPERSIELLNKVLKT